MTYCQKRYWIDTEEKYKFAVLYGTDFVLNSKYNHVHIIMKVEKNG